MTVIILLLSGGGVFVFLGQLLSWFIEQEPRLYGWSVYCYVVAVAFAVCAVIELISGIARLVRRWGTGRRRRRR
ncbi:MAG: hypothetical protein K2N30_02655 [Clostridia bacterium]|nr:hypothetical protein [Clostridia bacterium]